MNSAKVFAAIVLLLSAGLLPVVAQENGTPSVTVDDQSIVGSRVYIEKVVSKGPGWLVVHEDIGGKPGPVIGYAAVRDGENPDVVVAVDSQKATDKLFAMLHTDAGTVGVYEFPGPDVPVFSAGVMVNVPFTVLKTTEKPMAQRIELKASNFQFSPGTVRVKAGVPVELHVVSTEGIHGLAIPDLKINQRLDQGKEVVVSFTPDRPGRYPFRCSVPCGTGHLAMKGELIVE
jgi:heme/copper-type cytochrome/quinol oxidase subunit 2